MRHFVNDTITRQAKPLQWQILCRAFGQARLGQWHFHLELIKRSIHSKKKLMLRCCCNVTLYLGQYAVQCYVAAVMLRCILGNMQCNVALLL